MACVMLRLAACGFVHRTAGSGATALFHILCEILDRGHKVDFYHLPGMWDPTWLEGRTGFRAIEVSDPTCMAIWRRIDSVHPRLSPPIGRFIMAGFPQIANPVTFARMGRLLAASHVQSPYSAVIALNMLCPWRIAGLRTVSWTQGPPQGESDFLTANARTLCRQLGLGYFAGLMAGYMFKHMHNRANAKKSDFIIVGSQWSVQGWERFGVPAAKLTSLPFPLGPEAMKPPAIDAGRSNPFLFLHIGRIVPRKRLDLLVRGFSEFRRSFPDARLLVVGRQDYGRDLAIARADEMMSNGIEYRDAVPRSEVSSYLTAADCVVQTSENENFGAAVAEALAAGRPVLVGPSNGTRDYIPASSVVFSEYTPTAVAAGMVEIARRLRADRHGLSADARAAAEHHFNLRTVTDRVLELVRS